MPPVRRALIVDDNPVNLCVARRMVERLGLVTHTARSGQEALDSAEHYGYDLILMDCLMPGLDGLKTTAELRRRECSGLHTPIIAVSTNPILFSQEQCLAAGMDGFLTQPLRFALLRSVAREIMRGSHRATQRRFAIISRYNVLDRDILNSLADTIDGLGPNGLQDLMDLYVRSATTDIASIAAGLSERDAMSVANAVSSLCGASGNVGAVSIEALCADLAPQSPHSHTEERIDLPVQLSQELRKVIAEFAEYREEMMLSPQPESRVANG